MGSFFTFDKFLTPVLIKVVYWIGLFAIVLWMLLGIFGSAFMPTYQYGYESGPGMRAVGVIVSLIGGALLILFWRVWCEIWMVFFSMNDRLGVLVEQTRRASSS